MSESMLASVDHHSTALPLVPTQPDTGLKRGDAVGAPNPSNEIGGTEGQIVHGGPSEMAPDFEVANDPSPRKDDRSINMEILAGHARWLRGDAEGKRAKLGFRDLSGWVMNGLDLRGADLRGASLREAKLANANLDGADLFMADLENADLHRATLRAGNLSGARMSGCDLRDANLEGAKLGEGVVTPDSQKVGLASTGLSLGARGTELRQANMAGAMLIKADLSGCDMTGANLSGADLSGADLSNSVLAEAQLEDVSIDGTKFTGADLSDAEVDVAVAEAVEAQAVAPAPVTAKDLEGRIAGHESWLASGGLEGTQLSITNADLGAVDMSGRNLASVRLRRCVLGAAKLSGAQLRLADLSDTKLEGTDFSGADLRGATLRKAAFIGANLTGADLGPAEVNGVTWPCNMDTALLRHTRFENAKVQQLRLDQVKLTTDTLRELNAAGVPPIVLRKLTVLQDGEGDE